MTADQGLGSACLMRVRPRLRLSECVRGHWNCLNSVLASGALKLGPRQETGRRVGMAASHVEAAGSTNLDRQVNLERTRDVFIQGVVGSMVSRHDCRMRAGLRGYLRPSHRRSERFVISIFRWVVDSNVPTTRPSSLGLKVGSWIGVLRQSLHSRIPRGLPYSKAAHRFPRIKVIAQTGTSTEVQQS
jgi:hypothetical protein